MFRIILLVLIIFGVYALYRKVNSYNTYRPNDPNNCKGKCVGCPHINRCLSQDKPEFRNPLQRNDKDNNYRP